jgi:hypothetical protein
LRVAWGALLSENARPLILSKTENAALAPYKLSIERHSTYLHATVLGDNTPNTVLRYMKGIAAECLRAEIFNVLIVVNLDGPGISMLEVYKVIASSSDSAVGLGMHVAYVDLNLLHSEANMLLAENVAMTRGIPVRTFRDVEQARDWLIEQTSGRVAAQLS